MPKLLEKLGYRYFLQYVFGYGLAIILLLYFFRELFLKYSIKFYYLVWIGKVYKRLLLVKDSKNKFLQIVAKNIIDIFFRNGCSDDRYSKIILKSQNKNTKLPEIILSKHLYKIKSWKGWSFAIYLLYGDIIIRKNKGKEESLSLNIDLTNQQLGIYSNIGKKFLREEYKEKYLKLSEDIDIFLKSDEIEKKFSLKNSPLRWASGGALPIVINKNQKHYFVLFFRDIDPIGWNIANGASENDDEYVDLWKLSFREFYEELVLLDAEPKKGDNVNQKLFKHNNSIKVPVEDYQQKVTEKHKFLRMKEDEFKSFDRIGGPSCTCLTTKYKVNIRDGNLLSDYTVDNVLFNINPEEQGIEIIRLYSFNIEDNDYIIDGEIMSGNEALVRRPVMLLSCDYAYDAFLKYGKSFGDKIINDKWKRKKLDIIPKEEYHVFDYDIRFKKEHNIEYYKEFDGINEKDIIGERDELLSIFCPVTWKSIEMIFNHKDLVNLTTDKKYLNKLNGNSSRVVTMKKYGR